MNLSRLFKPLPAVCQIFDAAVELVQSSCGMSIPYFDYVGEREQLNDWATKKEKKVSANTGLTRTR